MDVKLVDSDLVYLMYMTIFIGCYMLAAGTVSTFACSIFVEHIYTRVKGE